MNERLWWGKYVKPAWHQPGSGRAAWKVEDAYSAGKPDVDCCFNGVMAKIELKWDAEWPKRADTPLWFSFLDKTKKTKSIVSAGQMNHLEEWRRCGGNAFVLIGVGKEWVLLEQGKYDNVPMTKEQLYEAAELTYVTEGKPVWSVVDQIPPFIEQYYGK